MIIGLPGMRESNKKEWELAFMEAMQTENVDQLFRQPALENA